MYLFIRLLHLTAPVHNRWDAPPPSRLTSAPNSFWHLDAGWLPSPGFFQLVKIPLLISLWRNSYNLGFHKESKKTELRRSRTHPHQHSVNRACEPESTHIIFGFVSRTSRQWLFPNALWRCLVTDLWVDREQISTNICCFSCLAAMQVKLLAFSSRGDEYLP